MVLLVVYSNVFLEEEEEGEEEEGEGEVEEGEVEEEVDLDWYGSDNQV